MQHSLGAITVSSPGTPVRITINQATPTTVIPCQSLLFQVLSNATHTNTGRVYILDKDQRRVGTLAIPTANTIPAYSVTIPNAPGALDPSSYFVDADNAGDGVDASYVRP